jgi:hypothetical protein
MASHGLRVRLGTPCAAEERLCLDVRPSVGIDIRIEWELQVHFSPMANADAIPTALVHAPIHSHQEA